MVVSGWFIRTINYVKTNIGRLIACRLVLDIRRDFIHYICSILIQCGLLRCFILTGFINLGLNIFLYYKTTI